MSTLDAIVHARLVGDESGSTGRERIAALVRAEAPLLSSADVARVVAGVEARLSGIGALEPLVTDPSITDILVNGPGAVWVERGGGLVRTEVTMTRAEIDLLVEQVVAPLGLRVDPTTPIAEARLPDGSRVHVVVPPLAVAGPYVAIRRFATRTIGLERMAPAPVAALVRAAVRTRANVVVSGATGCGKTTLLNALGAEIPAGERVITVEDAAELQLPSEHVVRLEGRPATVDGPEATTTRELLRAALRMRPDRVLIGEVRGPEAFDLLQAMNTGHDGCLSTVHANGTEDAIDRLELLVLLADVGLTPAGIRRHLARAVDLIVHVRREPDGRRAIVEVAEVLRDPEVGGRATRLLVQEGRVVAEPSRPVALADAMRRTPGVRSMRGRAA